MTPGRTNVSDENGHCLFGVLMGEFAAMFTDVSDMLKPAEREKADQWKAKHQTTCAKPEFVVVSNVSGFGYRLKVLCQTCGAKEEVTDVPSRDPAPKH